MELKDKILEAVKEYVESPEAWDDAQLVIDPTSGTAHLVEEEEAGSLPDEIDVYDIMDLVGMNPAGEWIPDMENISSVATSYV